MFSRISEIRKTCNQKDKFIDVFAFAVTLYEIMSQRFAWGPNTPEPNIKDYILGGRRPDVSEIDQFPEIRDLIIRGWAHDATTRYSFNEATQKLKQQMKINV